MLSALRGIIQRWVGMTTEVQTAEPADAPAVPGSAPVCSADYAGGQRRMKRPGNLTNEAADLKRPRTAPTTPIDSHYNGGSSPVGKLMASAEPDDPRSKATCAHPSPGDHQQLRPSAAASAPAALNRPYLRSQSSVSTVQPTTCPASVSGCGLGLANSGGAPASSPSPAPSRQLLPVTTAATTGTVSGVVAAPQQPPAQPCHNSNHHPQQQQQPQQLPQRPGEVAPDPFSQPLQSQGSAQQHLQQQASLPAVPAVGGAAAAAASTPGRHHANNLHHCGQHGLSHGHHHNTQLHPHEGSAAHPPHHNSHHRHHPLEEQVFSPAFHRPSLPSTPSKAGGGTSPADASPPQPPSPSEPQQGQQQGPSLAAAVAAVAAVAASAAARLSNSGGVKPAGRPPQQQQQPELEPSPPQPHSSTLPLPGHVHAIDLNVVEGVAVDTDDDEDEQQVRQQQRAAEDEAAAAVLAAASEAAAAAGASAGADELSGLGAEPRDAAAAPAPGETESERPDAAAGVAAVAGPDEEVEEDYGDAENDENAPVGHAPAAAAAAAALPPHPHRGILAGGHQRTHPHPHAQHWGTVTTTLVGATGMGTDSVLVASAPRSLAAAVAAVLPSAAATTVTTSAAAATAAQDGSGAAISIVATAAAAAALPGAAVAPAAAVAAAAHEEEDDEEDEEEDGFAEFDPLVFIRQLPPLEACVPPHRPALLPRQTRSMARRKTLVLDLDETLVHSSLEAVQRFDFTFPVVFNGTEHKVFVRQRPHLKEFMVRAAALFEVVVFTASQRIYAERLLDILDPGQELVRHRIYRDSCVVVDGNYLKDLSILGRDLAHTIIVDNSPQAFGFQVDNGIPIASWYDDDSDSELLKLLPFLESLAGAEVEDVRPRIQSQFRLRELIEQA